MSGDADIRGIKVHYEVWNESASRTCVFLHGFTGSTKTWEEIIRLLPSHVRAVAIDLTGHGLTEAPTDPSRYETAQQVADLDALFDHLQLSTFTLVGYSMGGRIALSYTLTHPHRVDQLILESSSPGLSDPEEREKRKESDDVLARRIEQDGLEAFVDYWEKIPLFRSQLTLSLEKQRQIRLERLSQRPVGLANSLRGIGTGSQPSNWERLDALSLPILLLTGEYDEKFCRIAYEMVRLLPNAKVKTILEAGHAIHVEKPEQFATIITEHL